jgi:hypothetical protein
MAKLKDSSHFNKFAILLLGFLVGILTMFAIVFSMGFTTFQDSLFRTFGLSQGQGGTLLEMDEEGVWVQTADKDVDGVWVQMADTDDVWVQMKETVTARNEAGEETELEEGVWVQVVDDVWVQFGGNGRKNASAKLKEDVWVQVAGKAGGMMQLGQNVWVQFQEKGAARAGDVWVQ